MRRSPLAYTPRRNAFGRLGALASTAYLGSLATAAFLYSSPIVLAAVGLATVLAARRAGALRAVGAAARWGLLLAVIVIAVNALASQRGETILLRGWELAVLGRIDVSAEALAEGAVLALRIVIVLAIFAVHSACVDPDRLLRLVRPLARHSALTATLATRIVPLAAADLARLRESASLRGPGAAAVGRAALARRVVAGSLDRAVDVAAALELRGYARGAAGRSAPHRSRHDARFLAAGLAILALSIAARVAGVGAFEAYPTVSVATGTATLLLAGALVVISQLPFAGLDRGAGRR